MRFLKLKIQKARAALRKKSSLHSKVSNAKTTPCKEEEKIQSHLDYSPSPKRRQKHKKKSKKEKAVQTKNECKSTKNIVINYGKAIAAFASSDLAIPYLADLIKDEEFSYDGFVKFIIGAKETIGGIASLRSLLLENENENEEIKRYKKVLRMIGEVFIKYFSVNWIVHGRMTHKIVYLKYRTRMLRRIQNPEYFTYIREHKENKQPEVTKKDF